MNNKRIYIAGVSGTTRWVCVGANNADEAISLAKDKIKGSNAAREIGNSPIDTDEVL